MEARGGNSESITRHRVAGIAMFYAFGAFDRACAHARARARRETRDRDN